MKYLSRRDVLNQFVIFLITLGRWERYRNFPKPIQASIAVNALRKEMQENDAQMLAKA